MQVGDEWNNSWFHSEAESPKIRSHHQKRFFCLALTALVKWNPVRSDLLQRGLLLEPRFRVDPSVSLLFGSASPLELL